MRAISVSAPQVVDVRRTSLLFDNSAVLLLIPAKLPSDLSEADLDQTRVKSDGLHARMVPPKVGTCPRLRITALEGLINPE